MIYLWPQTTSIENRLHSGFGVLTRPADETIVKGIREKRLWACDNGVFSGKFEAGEFFRFLGRLLSFRSRCLFVVAPDVYEDARGTLALFPVYAGRIRAMGYPVAFVAQDGAEGLSFPPCDWLFIGGSTDWKLSPAAGGCILRAKRAGLRVHVGRVNSLYRIGVFEAWGADSCDGTYPVHNPEEAARRFNRPLKYPMPIPLRLAYRAVLAEHRIG